MKYDLTISETKAAYDNKGAHNQLKSMMARRERLVLNFGIDTSGYYYAMIESKTISKFIYRVNNLGFTCLFNYIQHGKCDLSNTDPLILTKSKGKNTDQIRTDLMATLIKYHKGRFQFMPSFLDKPDTLTATARFPYGSIIFKIPRTDEIINLLDTNKLYA